MVIRISASSLISLLANMRICMSQPMMKSWNNLFKVELDRENPICILGELLDFWVLPIVMIVIWNHQICKAVVVVEVVVVQEDWKLSDCIHFIYEAGKHDPSIILCGWQCRDCGFRLIHGCIFNFLNLLCHHSGCSIPWDARWSECQRWKLQSSKIPNAQPLWHSASLYSMID